VRPDGRLTRRLLFCALALGVAACSPGGERASEGAPHDALPHDHTPRFGGIVGMVGDYHVEYRLGERRTHQVWLSDRLRQPIAPEAAGSPQLSIGNDGARQTLPMRVAGDHLEAVTDGLDAGTLQIGIDLELHGEAVSIQFLWAD